MPNPKRILIITDAWQPQVNGVVRTYEYLALELALLGHEVRVIGPSDFPLRLPMPLYREIELTLFPTRRLKRLIADFVPDAIHIGTEGPLGWAARRYCLKNKIRFTTAYHTQFPGYIAKRMPFLKNFVRERADAMLRRFHAASAGIITTTASLEEDLRTRGYETPFYTMNRGVPVDLFNPGESDLFTHLPKPVALYAGRVAIEKNIEDFLSMAWHGTKVVVGDGPGLNALKKKYPHVLFTGRKTGQELADHYRAADVFVFPSRTDTFGIVLIEALSCGLPVAAFDVTGPKDIITHPSLGALHADDLAVATARALAQKEYADHRHDYVLKHYTWQAAARRFLDILKETGTDSVVK